MDTKDIANLFLAATARVEFYWNFYVVFAVAFVGWVISAKRAFSPTVKWVLSIGYVAFVLMNSLGLWGAYTFAEALRQDLLAAENVASMTHVYYVLQNSVDYEFQRKFVFLHIPLAAAMILFLWRATRRVPG